MEDILSKAYTLHNKQLDFHMIGLTVLYQNIQNIQNTLKKTLQNDENNISEKIHLKVRNYDYLIGESKKLSNRILKKAKEVS